VSATCTGIFFGGDAKDMGVSAICGLASGLIELGSGKLGETGKIAMDMVVGMCTGAITGLAFYNAGQDLCISSILLGTLYWFFYGTAFVIGLLEIIAGELETGVTRFIAVSVKTFVLCLGAGFGLMMTLDSTNGANADWFKSASYCGTIDLDDQWWRLPLYVLCCCGVLGQYRFPIRYYWRPLVVQLVAYEVQYQVQQAYSTTHADDNMDNAASNTLAAMAAVLVASLLSISFRTTLTQKILQREENGCLSSCYHQCQEYLFDIGASLGLFRDSSALRDLLPKLKESYI